MNTLVRQAWERARSSPSLRLSVAGWLLFGLAGSVALTLALAGAAHAQSAALVAENALAWFAVGLFLLVGVAMLKTPDGADVNKVGIPNGLSLIRAWACFPMMLCAFLPFAGNDGPGYDGGFR